MSVFFFRFKMEQLRNDVIQQIGFAEADVEDMIQYTEIVIELAELQAILNRVRELVDLIENLLVVWVGMVPGTPPPNSSSSEEED